MVGGVGDARTCNHCHVLVMLLFKQCLWSWILSLHYFLWPEHLSITSPQTLMRVTFGRPICAKQSTLTLVHLFHIHEVAANKIDMYIHVAGQLRVTFVCRLVKNSCR